MKIYTFAMPTFNSTKAVLTAEELELDFELIKLDAKAGEHKTPAHLARHPLGKIPVLKHGAVTLFESMAIVRYLLSRTPNALAGDSAPESDQWADYVILQPGRAVGVFYWEEVIRGRMNGLTPDSAALKRAGEQLERELAPLEARLAEHAWISGATFGLADIVAASYTWALADLSFDLGHFDRLSDWHDRATARPAFERLRAHYA